MRTINLIFAILLTASISAFANNTTATQIASKNMHTTADLAGAKSINLQLENVMTDRFTVRLKNTGGAVLFFEKVKNTHQYAKRFDLNQLTDGNYYFEIEMPEVEAVQKPFTIQNGRVNIAAIGVDYLAITSPNLVTFDVKSAVANAIDVQLNNNTNKACKVRIKDVHGHVIYFEKIGKEGTIAKRYVLENLAEGSYTLEIETGEGKLVKTFTLSNKKVVWKTENAVAKA